MVCINDSLFFSVSHHYLDVFCVLGKGLVYTSKKVNIEQLVDLLKDTVFARSKTKTFWVQRQCFMHKIHLFFPFHYKLFTIFNLLLLHI